MFKEILKVKGHNNFKQPHMGNNALILQNELPTNLEIPMGLVMDSIDLYTRYYSFIGRIRGEDSRGWSRDSRLEFLKSRKCLSFV